MAKINIRSLSRVTYDLQNKALRSYFDPGGTMSKLEVASEMAAVQFLEDNLDLFKFDLKSLEQALVNKASGFDSVRYMQNFRNVPVYGALIVVNVSRKDNCVISCYNNFDYNIPAEFVTKPAITEKQALKIAQSGIERVFKKVRRLRQKLYIYRHYSQPDEDDNNDDIGKRPDSRIKEILSKVKVVPPKEGDLHLVWQIIVDVEGPISTSLEILVEAAKGKIIRVTDRSDYVNGTGKVFYPDPVTTSGNTTLCTTSGSISPASTFNPERRDVTLQGLDAASGGNYYLTGDYVRIKDDESPTFAPPAENTPDFNYASDNRHFLSVMTYYWIDTVQRLIKNELNVNNAGDYQIEVDAQGMNGNDNSHFVPGSTSGNGRIAFGEGGAPDASDAAVILHEYGHAIHDNQGFAGGTDLREGFSYIMTTVYRDRFNPNQIAREEVFPFDNNQNCSYAWNANRRVNLTESYSDSGYASYASYFKGDIWATTVWQIYLALGGASIYENKREWAANVVLKLYLEANVGYGNITAPSTEAYANHQRMAEALLLADGALNNWNSIPDGMFHKVIKDRCINRGLFDPLAVDVYIDDGRNGGYDYLGAFWNSQDLVVRRNSSDSPTMGHEQPIVDQTNYLWVRVKKKGSGDPGTVTVKAFGCSPGTGLTWPTHWTATSPASINATTLGTSTEEWVGPFEFTPTEVGHACVLAIVEATNDPANTQGLSGSVSHGILVPFDNNIGQRNLSPVEGSGKQKRGFRVINSSNKPARISLDVKHKLPRGWELDFDVPDIENIPLGANEERWVNMRVNIPPDREFRRISDTARVTITALADGIPDGGMTFEFVHPSRYPWEEKPEEGRGIISSSCCKCINTLLEGADVEGEIRVEIRFKRRT